MSLELGRRLGPFEVVELLGQGGMGEVYRARDTRLHRDVALKVLPDRYASDPQRLARFRREALVLASLVHPHIATLFEIEESGTETALVMELVDGDTLDDRLARYRDPARGRGLPLDEVLRLAGEIAEALEAAHHRGVVHRDLKPANIKIRDDGSVKVLDFGLASIFRPDVPADVTGETVTVTTPQTMVGTPAYMSPEQARGEPADQRADVWAFGCVLYEMLTGRRAFAGQSTADVLAGVLDREADLTLVPPDTPPAIRRLLRRALSKNVRTRLRDMGDARLEINDAQAGVEEVKSDRPRTRSAGMRMLYAAATLAGVAVAAAGALWLAPQRSPSPVVRTVIPADTSVRGTDRGFAFTPDGTRLAYIGSDARQIFVRPLDTLEPLPILTTAAYIRGLFPSPDGLWFGFIEDAFTLRKISSAGGAPVTVVAMDGPSRGAAWGPDDTFVFATAATDTGLQRVAAGGGPVTVLTRPDHARGEADHVQPSWLPGGRSLLFTILPAQGGIDAAKVAVFDLARGTWRTVIEGGYAARYVDSGHLVYAASGALWATRFDLARLAVQGAAVEMLRPLTVGTVGPIAEFDIASNGTLAYSRGAIVEGSHVLPVWVDREGRETPLPVPPDNYRHPRLSPDGKRLAICVAGDIYVWDLTSPWAAASRMTFAPVIDWFPVWTPDSRRIVFGSWRGGRFSNLYMLHPDTGSTERLTDSPDMQLPTAITRDGMTVIFHSFTKSLQALRLRATTEPETLVETVLEERNGEISPDGRWLAYEGESPSRPGQLDIYVRPFPNVDRALWQVTGKGGMFPAWARSGRELFYITSDSTMVAVPVEASGMTWKVGAARNLFRGKYAIREGSLGRLYDVAADGRFLMLKQPVSADAPHFVIVQNWVAELARRVH
jgi:serine/threonine-protein kinase